eukprot:jgi/Psemu1/45187/gm1.45187_g
MGKDLNINVDASSSASMKQEISALSSKGEYVCNGILFDSFSWKTSPSYSTDCAELSITSSDNSLSSSIVDGKSAKVHESAEHPFNDANSLFNLGLYLPMDLLETAISPNTSRSDSLEALTMIQAIEYSDYIIELYREIAKKRYIPALLQYIRMNVQDRQCVVEAIQVLRWLLSLLDNSDQSDRKDSKSNNVLVFIQVHAISILVLALESHQSNDKIVHPDHHRICAFETIWEFLMDLVLSPSVVDDFFQKNEKENHSEHEKNCQRMELLEAVDICLDRTGHAMSFSWMTQVFQILNTLLRTKTAEGTYVPTINVRMCLWKKQIAKKCQQLLDKKTNEHLNDYDHYYYHWFKYEEASAAAVSFFWFCLRDQKDYLSESLDRKILTRFADTAMKEFPRSEYIQGVGYQIIQALGKESWTSFIWLSPPEPFSLGTTRTIINQDLPGCTSNSLHPSNTYDSEHFVPDRRRRVRRRKRKEKTSSSTTVFSSVFKTSVFKKLCVFTDDDELQDHVF